MSCALPDQTRVERPWRRTTRVPSSEAPLATESGCSRMELSRPPLTPHARPLCPSACVSGGGRPLRISWLRAAAVISRRARTLTPPAGDADGGWSCGRVSSVVCGAFARFESCLSSSISTTYAPVARVSAPTASLYFRSSSSSPLSLSSEQASAPRRILYRAASGKLHMRPEGHDCATSARHVSTPRQLAASGTGRWVEGVSEGVAPTCQSETSGPGSFSTRPERRSSSWSRHATLPSGSE